MSDAHGFTSEDVQVQLSCHFHRLSQKHSVARDTQPGFKVGTTFSIYDKGMETSFHAALHVLRGMLRAVSAREEG